MLIRDIIPPSPRRSLNEGGHCLAEASRVSGPKTTTQKQTSKKALALFTILFLILQFFTLTAWLLIAQPAQALVAISTGTVTQANMRLSVVAGTAFVDFSSAGALTPYIGYKLVITPVTDNTKSLTGYIKAAGTGETYGSEILTNTEFENTTGLSTYNASVSSVAGGINNNALQVTTTAASGDGYELVTTVSGVLYKQSVYGKKGTGSYFYIGIKDNGGTTLKVSYNTDSSFALKSVYATAISVSTRSLYGEWTSGQSGKTALFDVATFTQVLTPSATGVTITDTANGTNYAWTTEDSGFNRNDTTYTYAIYPGSASSTISDTNTHSYQLIDCADTAGQLGVDVTGAATLQNYTVVRCPAGGFQFEESATLTNSIGTSTSNDITIASDKTVTGTYNLFNDAAKAGSGTYSDAGNTTRWGSDPLFVSYSDFHLQSTSPAIDVGTNLSLTTDYAGVSVPRGTAPEIGAYEYPVPATPFIGTPEVSSDSAIRWNFSDNSSDEDGFSLTDSDGNAITTGLRSSVSYIDETNLPPATSFTRKIKAYNSYGSSPLTNSVTATTRGKSGGGFLPPSNAYANWLAQASPVPTLTPSPPAGPPPAVSAQPSPPAGGSGEQASSPPANQTNQNSSNQPLTKYLRFGQADMDVKRLQIFLNQDSDTRLANSGLGSSGKETNIFGRLTRAAVIKFQEKYTQDILAPWKLTKGTGFVGKTTTAKINEMMGR